MLSYIFGCRVTETPSKICVLPSV